MYITDTSLKNELDLQHEPN